MRTLAAFAALAALASAVALAQTPLSIETREHTSTIVAIDHTARTLSLKGEHGTVKMGVGPEVKRFSELKVGDQITLRYQESFVARISKPGRDASGAVESKPVIARGTGARPSATVTQEQKATVTIKAIDPAAPAVTLLTDEGDTETLKVRDKNVLGSFKAGDKVEIVYTEALIVSVR